MPVVGMVFKVINGERVKDLKSGANIGVKNKTNIKAVKDVDLPTLGRKGLSMEFEYKIDYSIDSKALGSITIEGDVWYLESGEAKIVESWKSGKKLPANVQAEVLNNIMRNCLLKSIILANDLQLPPPIKLPYAKPAKEEKAA